jgi:hypothetical protein
VAGPLSCRVVVLAVVVCGCDGEDDEQAARPKQPTAAMIARAITFATQIVLRATVSINQCVQSLAQYSLGCRSTGEAGSAVRPVPNHWDQ